MRLIIILLLCFNAFAIEITPVKKGEVVKQDGFFITAGELKKMRKINEDKKLLEKKVLKLEDLAQINKQRIELYKKEVVDLKTDLRKSRFHGSLKGYGGFVLGVLATSAAAYAAIQVSK